MDRTPGGVVLDKGEQQEGIGLEVVGQMLRRPLDAQHLLALLGFGVRGRRVEPRLVERLPELTEAPAIDGADLRFDLGIVHQQEAPSLRVAPGRRPDGGVEDLALHVLGDRIGLDPAHGASRVQGFVDVHRRKLLPVRCAAHEI